MSRENVEVVRQAHEHLNNSDIESLVELCDEVFRLDMSERIFNPDTYEGHDGIRRFHSEVRDVWEYFQWDPEELIDAGEEVVALVHAHGRGRGSGLEIDRHIALVWSVREGKATSLRLYVDRERALEAVGPRR
jgi:ketosteroid isomerase-like protein